MSYISLMALIGTGAFAVSGALVAIEKKLDHYGIVFLAIITAVGGGIIRDLIIDLPLPAAFENPVYVVISIISAVVTIAFYKWITRLQRLITIFDAVGLAAFTSIGARAAFDNDVYTVFIVMTLAMLTGVGGGMLRDIFVKEIPFVFRKEVYAVASLVGALVFWASSFYLNVKLCMYICFGVTLIIRLLSVRFRWHLATVKTTAVISRDEREKKQNQRGKKRRQGKEK